VNEPGIGRALDLPTLPAEGSGQQKNPGRGMDKPDLEVMAEKDPE